MLKSNDAVIVAYGRTACAKAKKGSFSNLHPVEFGAQALTGVLKKIPSLHPKEIDDVIVGCAMPFGVQGWNISKLILQRAEFPDSVSSQTINRFCSSGLQAIASANNSIRCGEEEIIVAGGVESMSMVPMAPSPETFNPWLERNRPGAYIAMGLTAENVAQEYGITREEMESMAVESHRRAAEAQKAGFFDDHIIPVTVPDENGKTPTITRDEGIRPATTMEVLAELVPCFKEDGIVTAATSSQMTDGAGFAVLMSADKAAEKGIRPLARLISYATAGVPTEIMGIGPIEAIPKVLKKTGLSAADMDVIELNEAFASQALACIRTLGLNPEKVNPWGGAMALGHPLGATGAMLSCKALSFLERDRGTLRHGQHVRRRRYGRRGHFSND